MIATVVLAAGASRRMGRPKALLELGDQTFIERIGRLAAQCGATPVVVVVGPPDGERVRARLPEGAVPAWNPTPERGMLSSVQIGLARLPAAAQAVLVWPVDLPAVSAATVTALIAQPGEQPVVPRCHDRGGHPIRIPRRLFPEVASLPSAEGLRGLFARHPAIRLAVDDPTICQDIDTAVDYENLRRSARPK